MNTNSIAALALMSGGLGALEAKQKEFKQPKKCSLPECEKITDHRGGYCSREHCVEHRRILKNETNV